MEKGIIFNIKRFAIHDGPGLRTTVFFKGCPLQCWWCHNPESIKLRPETITKPYTMAGDTILYEDEAIGKEMTVDDVMTEINKELIFMDESDGGVTFSGGEPLMQIDFLLALLEKCRQLEIHTAIDTSGYAKAENFNQVIDKANLFLYDLKMQDDEKHKKITGVSNQLIIQNLRKLDEANQNVIIRIPIIPQINDTKQELNAIKKLLSSLKVIREVNLLPFHKIGQEKYKRLNRANKMQDFESPTDDEMKNLKREFETEGFKVKIGG